MASVMMKIMYFMIACALMLKTNYCNVIHLIDPAKAAVVHCLSTNLTWHLEDPETFLSW